ncbi:glycosyltransferase family 8 protein [Enterococcus pallens]|uniref:8 glycosyltransferase n=1 Tax=Enterococcus pallens ATCC BAA-351 TaxID=1158607 RepID=R2QB89_9ENTE|nr:glycosyltransferase family 8 protein [Enterococcus pallens]EOH93707.1 8 glycosyltransferase [Enterococcus pallens ATCC BAA-351]EOU24547.1 8 glycosyltransferase [Enterococcus pallens ATCC BAA-351]
MFHKKNVIPVVTASDENYAPYLSVMLSSLLDHVSEEVSLNIYVIDDEISEASKDKLNETVQNKSDKATIQYLTVDGQVYEDFLVSDHITTTAYYRISLPKILKKYDYEKVLYIDADTLILDDVTELYQQDLKQKTIGAVIDPGQTKALERLGIDSEDYYFNSGVMVIDINRWNDRQITEKTIDFLKNHGDRIIYHDQDALNAVLYEDWAPLHPKWNMQSSLIFDRHPAPNSWYEELYKEGNEEPSIVHFTGHDKPWNTLEGHPYQEAYMDLLADSIFKKAVKA